MTAEPRDVEGAVYDDVYAELSLALGTDDTADEDVDFKRDLTARIMLHFAAADRENAELRGEVAEGLNAVEYFDAQSKRRRDERDALRAQLAAAQAQLADERAAHDIDLAEEVDALEAAEARLEAVRTLIADARANHDAAHIAPFVFADEIAAALSAAPQPEPTPWDQPLPAMTPEEFRREHEGRWEQPEPPASDEPARCEHGRTAAHYINPDFIGPYALAANLCPGPAASGTSDGGR